MSAYIFDTLAGLVTRICAQYELPTTTYYYLLLPTNTYYYLLLPTTTYYHLLPPTTYYYCYYS